MTWDDGTRLVGRGRVGAALRTLSAVLGFLSLGLMVGGALHVGIALLFAGLYVSAIATAVQR